MGLYIQTSEATGKAAYLVNNHDAKIVTRPSNYYDIPEGQTLICVAHNGMFDVAGIMFNEREFLDFSNPRDSRPKTWLLIDSTRIDGLLIN